MKVLFLATYGDFLATFELSNVKIWKELGCEVHCASNFSEKNYNLKTGQLDEVGAIRHEIQFARSPFSKKNIEAYRQLCRLIREEKIEVIDCHNAVVGVFARLAALQCGVKKVVYTPHSFFFYKGCPMKNRILYKTAESWLARCTDLLIAINQEDYEAARKMKVRGKALYVPGIGIDAPAIKELPKQREMYRREFQLEPDARIFVSVGELIPRKNHICAIRAFAKANLKNAYYLICGIGQLREELQEVIDSLGMHDRIRLLGYRLDAKEIMKASDVYVFPSFQEGLPVALMEAMACGLPCITSKIRGNTDLIEEGKGGRFFSPEDEAALCGLLQEYARDPEDWKSWGEYNQNKIQKFDIQNVRGIMWEEYQKLLNG